MILLDDVTATGAGLILNVQNFDAQAYGIFQVEITGVATVELQGRTSANMPWAVIDTHTASGGTRTTLFPQMRAEVTALSSGLARAELIT